MLPIINSINYMIPRRRAMVPNDLNENAHTFKGCMHYCSKVIVKNVFPIRTRSAMNNSLNASRFESLFGMTVTLMALETAVPAHFTVVCFSRVAVSRFSSNLRTDALIGHNTASEQGNTYLDVSSVVRPHYFSRSS